MQEWRMNNAHDKSINFQLGFQCVSVADPVCGCVFPKPSPEERHQATVTSVTSYDVIDARNLKTNIEQTLNNPKNQLKLSEFL